MTAAFKKADRRKIMSGLIFGLSILVFLWSHSLTWSQEKGFPNKPIKIVIPFEAGGASDLGPRATQEYLAQEFKVPIILENKPGASGAIGAGAVLKAPPDGYSILKVTDSIFTAPMQSPNPTYDPFKDFLALCQYGQVPALYGVHVSSPFKTLGDFIKEAKKNPGKLTFGTTNIGGGTHVSLELFKKDAGLDFKIVPYKGTGPAVAALLGKHIDMLALTFVALLPYVKSGEIRSLAVTDQAPGGSIPTIMEAGYARARMSLTQGYMVPANIPKPIYERLVRSFEQVEKKPALVKKLEDIGITPIYRNGSDYAKFMKEKLVTTSKYLEELNITASN
jgi:tripartite-type tricarboxylate transporter receptor subunit TctC